MTPIFFGPRGWKYRVAVDLSCEDNEIASLGCAIKNLVLHMLTLKGF